MTPNIISNQLYTYGGDLCAIGLSILCLVFFKSSYTTREKNVVLFRNASIMIVIASVTSILFHSFINNGTGNDIVVWLLHDITYDLLVLVYASCIIYLSNIVRLLPKNSYTIKLFVYGLAILHAVLEFQAYFTHFGFWIERDVNNIRVVHENYYYALYIPFYLVYSVLLLYIFLKCRNRLVSKVYNTIALVITISLSMVIIQYLQLSTALLCFASTLPVAASLFLFHYSPYDSVTGALNSSAFTSYIHNSVDSSTAFIFLHMDVDDSVDYDGLSLLYFRLSENYFKGSYTFKITDNLMVFAVRRTVNISFESNLDRFMDDADKLQSKFGINYKAVLIEANDSCHSARDYIDISFRLAAGMKNASLYRATIKDYEKHKRTKFIADQIRDIENSNDLNDERVLVYCQPVLDTRLGQFTTAEALMRLKLPEIGLVFPDEFIPIAEKYNLIHTLTKVILYKTCREIRFLDDNGYKIDRISVNCSMIELKDSKFCDDILNIIDRAGTQYDRIALELTESNSEADFELTKKIIGILRHHGMKFYLDDFGTGYSNFSRILGLPIDIIKFDRSLTILSGNNEESKYMVNSFSDIFAKAQYQVLYEGVENEADEDRCKGMNALYLQGYKYSKPIPIEELSRFLQKKAAG